MRHFTHNGKKYKVDALGYLLDAEEWDENFTVHKAYEMKMPNFLPKSIGR